MPRKSPNILLLYSDQHTASILGCMGDHAALSPNLDRLCAAGLVFERAYCASPVCLPSRMSLLTGRDPHLLSCWTNDDILASDIPTWLHMLGAEGYETTLVGRMHALGPDQLHGYMQRHVGDHSPNWPGVDRTSLGVLEGTASPYDVSIVRSGIGRSSYQIKDKEVTDAAIEQLEKHSERMRKGKAKPFCITVGFILPHPPYVCDAEDFEHMSDRVALPRLPVSSREHPWIKLWREKKELQAISTSDVQRARIAYYGLVREMDRNIGAIRNALSAHGLEKDTLIIYTSDHGDHLGERGLFWKHTLYEESVRVPLIMSWPESIRAGVRIHSPVPQSALPNTILDLAGLPNLPSPSQPAFTTLIQKSSSHYKHPIFSEYSVDSRSGWAEELSAVQRSVISNDHKLIYYDGFDPELFNLDSDPDEQINLAADPEYDTKKQELLSLLMKGWSPSDIRKTMAEQRADLAIITKWANTTNPPDLFRWPLNSDQNYLAP